MTTPDDLERVAMLAWPALEAHRIGDWSVRFAHGYSKRANSANPLVMPARLTPDRLDAIERFYSDRGAKPIVRLPEIRDIAAADGMLDARGYVVVDRSRVMTLPTTSMVSDGCALLPDAETWLDVFQALTGEDGAQTAGHRRILNAMTGQRAFATVRDSGRIAACGLGVHVDGVVGLFDIVTHPDFRRRGLAARLCAGLVTWAAEAGAHTVFLQVVESNSGAIRLYESLGFTTQYRYWYRVGA